MSVIQLNRAYRVPVGSPALKLVLIMIADAVDDDGRGWVPVSRMVEWSELSERFIRKAIAELSDKRMIVVDKQGGGFRSNAYQLDLPTWEKERAEHRSIADAWKVHGVHRNGAPDAGCTPCRVHDGQGEGAPDAGGTVHGVHPEGAPGAPNSSIPSGSHLNPSFEKTGGSFPPGFPEELKPALADWWVYRDEHGKRFGKQGWAVVLRHAKGYSAEVVRGTVDRAMQMGWPGALFDRYVKEMASEPPHASSTDMPFWKKKEGAEQNVLFQKKEGAAEEAPEGWERAADELFAFDWRGMWPSWAAVPTANRTDIVAYLEREKKEGGGDVSTVS